MKIIAAILTHNRSKLLERCLESLFCQSRKPDKIVVINNGSTDKTEAMLLDRGVECITQANVGSAGGWHKAISVAYEREFDAVWLMDDDGFADPNALKNLEPKLIKGIACASSIVLQEHNPETFVFDMPKLNNTRMPVLFGKPRKYKTIQELEPHIHNGTYEYAQLFNGALISIGAIKKVGNINQNYFIYGDEVDFFHRIRKAGKVISVASAKHFHPDVTSRPYNEIKIYYYLKNTLILYRKYYPNFVLYQIGGIALMLYRITKKNGLKVTLSLLVGNLAPLFYTSIYRGLSGKIAKDYDF